MLFVWGDEDGPITGTVVAQHSGERDRGGCSCGNYTFAALLAVSAVNAERW